MLSFCTKWQYNSVIAERSVSASSKSDNEKEKTCDMKTVGDKGEAGKINFYMHEHKEIL